MPSVFDRNSRVIDIDDPQRHPLILITDMEGKAAVDNAVYLLDFKSTVSADYQLAKHADNSYMYTAFGNSPISMTIGGLQPTGVQRLAGTQLTRITNPMDIEEYYWKHNISSVDRKVLLINTMTIKTDNKGQPVSQTSSGGIYAGYMVNFTKLPKGEDLLQGYVFNIDLLCWRKSDAG